MASDMTKMRDEFTIVSNKAKKFLDFSDIFERDGPFGDCFHLFWVDGNIAVGNDVSQVFNGCSGEFTFFEFAVPLVLVEFVHDLFDVVYVFVFGG